MFMFQVLFAIIQPLIASGMGKQAGPVEPGNNYHPKKTRRPPSASPHKVAEGALVIESDVQKQIVVGRSNNGTIVAQHEQDLATIRGCCKVIFLMYVEDLWFRAFLVEVVSPSNILISSYLLLSMAQRLQVVHGRRRLMRQIVRTCYGAVAKPSLQGIFFGAAATCLPAFRLQVNQ